MSFSSIKCHDQPIKLLQDYMRAGRVASSYLFLGPEGVGKKLAALTFARALNCETMQYDCCDACPTCLKITKLQHPDLHLLGVAEAPEAEAPGVIKIEEIRRLQKDISLRPYEAKKKVFIIDNAERMTAEASNALLKVLEEPTAGSMIILVSAKPALLFKTIISRCRILKFAPMPRFELKEVLKKDYALDEGYAHFLAFFCEGRLGSALRLKDTALSRERDRVIDGFILKRGQAEPQGRDQIRVYLNMLAIWFRDLYLAKIGLPRRELVNSDRYAQIAQLTQDYSFTDLDRAFKCIGDSLLYLEQNINTKLLLSNLRIALKGQN